MVQKTKVSDVVDECKKMIENRMKIDQIEHKIPLSTKSLNDVKKTKEVVPEVEKINFDK